MYPIYVAAILLGADGHKYQCGSTYQFNHTGIVYPSAVGTLTLEK
jgi:hypothetical protein